MKRTFFYVFLAVAAVASDNIKIDWSKVKPITEYREFWQGKSFKPAIRANYQTAGKLVSNGNVAGRHDFPFKAALIAAMPFGDALCGGSLISRWAVLTAAHCIFNSANTIIILGASDIRDSAEPLQVRFRVQPTNYRIHQFFREGITNSDIGIVRFNFAIAFFTDAVNVIPLPTDEMLNNLFANENSLVAGFGQYSDAGSFSPSLRFVEMTTMANAGIAGCSLRFPGLLDVSHICTSGLGGRGWCPGDEGAPLIVLSGGVYIQIGIASIFPNSGCMSGNPSVYTRITSFMSFIRQHID